MVVKCSETKDSIEALNCRSSLGYRLVWFFWIIFVWMFSLYCPVYSILNFQKIANFVKKFAHLRSLVWDGYHTLWKDSSEYGSYFPSQNPSRNPLLSKEPWWEKFSFRQSMATNENDTGYAYISKRSLTWKSIWKRKSEYKINSMYVRTSPVCLFVD